MNDVMMEVINNNMNTKYYYKIKKKWTELNNDIKFQTERRDIYLYIYIYLTSISMYIKYIIFLIFSDILTVIINIFKFI